VITPARSPRLLIALPWLAAVVGLAVPLVAGNFAGWPYVVGWLAVLAYLWVAHPLRNADRPTRLRTAVAALVVLVLLIPLGSFYLLPAAILWLALIYFESSGDTRER
jgi:hypothetical protein